MLSQLVRIGGLAVLSALFASPTWAQTGSSTVRGTVDDSGGGRLPGVTVTATNQATGVTREGVTDGEGRFLMSALSPGVYTLRAELPGFQPQAREGVVLQVGQETTLSLTIADIHR